MNRTSVSQKTTSGSGQRGKPMTVGLVYDLRDDYLAQGFTEEQVAEFDSAGTIAALEKTLQSLGYTVQRIGRGLALAEQLAAGQRWDLVFNFAEGLSGRSREAQVPALLEMYGIPYTFSDPLVCALTLDKAMTKRVIQSAGLHTPRFCVVRSSADIKAVDLPLPLFAKPLAEGTGKGVDEHSRIESVEDLGKVCVRLLEKFRQPVLVEEYLPGREFTTAVLGTGPEAQVLGTMEIAIRKNAPAADYSYVVKELCEQWVDYFPMPQGRPARGGRGIGLAGLPGARMPGHGPRGHPSGRPGPAGVHRDQSAAGPASHAFRSAHDRHAGGHGLRRTDPPHCYQRPRASGVRAVPRRKISVLILHNSPQVGWASPTRDASMRTRHVG